MKTSYSDIHSADDLKEAILALRIRSERQKEHITRSFADLKESVKPMNLLKQVGRTFINTGKSNDIIKTGLGLGAGMLGKQILFGKSKGFFGKLWSSGLEIFLSRMVSRSVDGNSLASSKLVNFILRNRHPHPRKAGKPHIARLGAPVGLQPV